MHLSVLRPLSHTEAQDEATIDDETRRAEARAHLARNPSLQLVAELMGKLRSTAPAWWTAEQTRALWPTTTRMRWLKQRPDLRQAITTRLSGLAPNAARRFWPDEQSVLIDAVLDNGDVDATAFEDAFDPADLVVYGDARAFWHEFRERAPWEDDSPANKRLMAWLLRALLMERTTIDGVTRKPLLTAWDVKNAIDTSVWLRCIPEEVHVEVERARMKQEKTRPRDPFQARHEINLITPERIAEHIPLREMLLILERAEDALSFGSANDVADSEPPAPSSDAPRPSQIN